MIGQGYPVLGFSLTDRSFRCTPCIELFKPCFLNLVSKEPMTTASTQATNVANPQGSTEQLALYRLPKVLSLVPVSRSHWWAGVASGKFPAGIKLSDRVTVWRSTDIQNLIASLK